MLRETSAIVVAVEYFGIKSDIFTDIFLSLSLFFPVIVLKWLEDLTSQLNLFIECLAGV